jgi:uncharacterized protein (DUF1330 family)
MRYRVSETSSMSSSCHAGTVICAEGLAHAGRCAPRSSNRTHREKDMRTGLKFTAAIACGVLIGGGAVELLHAQTKPPAFVVSEIAVKDKEGYEENFLKAARKDISDHGGKLLAGGYNKTISLVGNEPPNRVVILQFENMDAVKAWREQGAMDMENTVGGKYASFRIYAVEGVTQ